MFGEQPIVWNEFPHGLSLPNLRQQPSGSPSDLGSSPASQLEAWASGPDEVYPYSARP
ncbi:MAG: hypothetical protein ABEN55_05770, partial [Bradymonadaceae bacterium]